MGSSALKALQGLCSVQRGDQEYRLPVGRNYRFSRKKLKSGLFNS